MKKHRVFLPAICMLAAFLFLTIVISLVDVQSIGPQGSSVGFATVNRFVHNLTGVHMALYTMTDWLSLVPLGIVMGFGLLGLNQWIRRKRLLKVDHRLLILGCFYLVVLAVYILFEVWVVNYRPVLIQGVLEVSYPSSTTMLVLCVMPAANMELKARIQSENIQRWVLRAMTAFTVFMVVGRLISGVHWFTDIMGGTLLSTGLVWMYKAFVKILVNEKQQ